MLIKRTYYRQGLFKLALTTLLLVFMSACAKPPAGHPPEEAYDPFEERNRAIHEFNKSIDRNLVRPVGVTYSEFLPDDIETPLARLAGNLSIPSDIVNNIFQLEMADATENLYRFAVNSTLGLAGFFDPATELGMPARNRTSFGETMHYWGVREGAYIELPFVGPSTERDTAGFFVDLFINPLSYLLESPWNFASTISVGADALARRGRFADTIDSVLYESADSYAQQKTLYIQNRRFELDGGDLSGFDDPYDEFGPPLEGDFE
ncbi:MAG: VacJ family lipoprotein [Pseudomonadota bacterium]